MGNSLTFQNRDFLVGASGIAFTGVSHVWSFSERSLFMLRISGYCAGDIITLQASSNIGEFAPTEWVPVYQWTGSQLASGNGIYQPLVYFNSPFIALRATISGSAPAARYWLAGSRADG